MNKNRVKGAIDSAMGTAKRRVGKVTGNTGMQVRGAVQQAKGKVETVVGKMRDSAHNLANPPSSATAMNTEAYRKNSSDHLA